MVSEKSFKLLVVSNTTPFFAVVQIIYFHDCRYINAKRIFIVFSYILIAKTTTTETIIKSP